MDNLENTYQNGLDLLKNQGAMMRNIARQKLAELNRGVQDFGENAQDAYQGFRGWLGDILPGDLRVTQNYGAHNPGIEVFSRGGNHSGTDFGVPVGTPVKLPPGRWQVLDAYARAGKGRIGDNSNRGYGNSILVQNLDTGEKLRFSHLSSVAARANQQINGGYIGSTGNSGNSTGPHLDLEYYQPQGGTADILKSRYGKYL